MFRLSSKTSIATAKGPVKKIGQKMKELIGFQKAFGSVFFLSKNFVYLQIGNLQAVECEEEVGEHQQI